MKYPKEYLEEIKNRLKVSTVVSKTVSLKKRGKEFVGLSPFKNEKTPSFTVNDEETKKICAEVISKIRANSLKDMGKVMGELKKTHADEIDFSKAGSMIKELLNK